MADLSDTNGHSPERTAGALKRKPGISRSTSAYPRKRAVTACQVCRLRRTKCDNQKPQCGFCVSTGAECVWEKSNNNSSFDPASLAIIEKINVLEATIKELAANVSSPLNTPTAPPTAPAALVYDDVARQHDRERLLPGNVERVWSWQAFRGLEAPSPNLLSHLSPSDHTPLPFAGLEEIDLSSAQRYVDAYFRCVNIKNPILDELETQTMVEGVFARGLDSSADTVLTLLICALGATSQNFPEPPHLSNETDQVVAVAYYSQAQSLFGSVLTESALVQGRVYFLAGTMLMTMLRPFAGWRMLLQSLMMCQVTASTVEASLEYTTESTATTAFESLYWSAWKSEREVRLELNPPDFQRPSMRFPPAFQCLSVSRGKQDMEDWYFYLSEISIWRIEVVAIGKIESIINAGKQDMLDTLADFADDILSQVSAWRDSLSPAVSLVPEDLAETLTKGPSIYKFVLRGRTTYIHELITWPFVYSCLHSLTRQVRHWKWFERGLAYHLERLIINRPGFYFRHHGTFFMVRSSARSASILLAAARTSSTRSALPEGWAELVQETIAMLHYWSDSIKAIRSLAEQLEKLYIQVSALPTEELG